MVRGLEKFREFFRNYNGSYVIIGGTACDIAINEAGLTPRATKDIDIILIVEAISPSFVLKFWEFVKEGGYELKEQGDKDRRYYRFTKPENHEFPYEATQQSLQPISTRLYHYISGQYYYHSCQQSGIIAYMPLYCRQMHHHPIFVLWF